MFVRLNEVDSFNGLDESETEIKGSLKSPLKSISIFFDCYIILESFYIDHKLPAISVVLPGSVLK